MNDNEPSEPKFLTFGPFEKNSLQLSLITAGAELLLGGYRTSLTPIFHRNTDNNLIKSRLRRKLISWHGCLKSDRLRRSLTHPQPYLQNHQGGFP